MKIFIHRDRVRGRLSTSYRTLCVFTACLVCAGIVQGTASAATYYLDPAQGGDDNAGTNTSPWKTMNKVGSSSHPGDAIRIVTIDANIFSATWPEGRAYYAPGATQFGITWRFDATYRLGQFANRDFWVIGPIKIMAIAPGSTDVGGRVMNGSMVNPSPTVHSQGYDSTMVSSGYDPTLNVGYNVSQASPLVLAVGSSIVSTVSVAQAGQLPQIDTAAVLTVLASVPADGSFRPPYSGTNKSIIHNKNELNYALLSTLTPVASTPTLSSVERYFERPWIDHQAGWTAVYQHPSENMPNYARDMATRIGEAALMLHLNYTNTQKETLLIRYVQLGLDFYGIVAAGGLNNWIGAGGHGSGRKWPILFAGLVLNDAGMKAIGAKSGDYLYDDGHGPANIPPDYVHFGEDDQTFYVAQLDVDITHSPSWKPDSRDDERIAYEQSDIGLPEWGIWHQEYPQYSNKWWGTKYRYQVGTCLSGLVLPALIMNVKPLWNHDVLFDYTDRYMALTAPGAPYETAWRSQSTFTAHMWDAYRSKYGAIWPARDESPVTKLFPIGDQQITAGQTLTLVISAVNPGQKSLTYSAAPLPSGATFVERTLTWTPATGQVGSYRVTFTVSDGTYQDTATITITVAKANSAPVLGSIGPKSINENTSLSFTISATDADAQDTLTYSATGLPNGATFTGQSFSWKPGYSQAGSYQVTFAVSDGHAQDTEVITITVANVNRTPTMTTVSDRSVDAGNSVEFSLAATDPDGDSLTYSAGNLPTGATLTGKNFAWTPTAEQIGAYDITFVVSDGGLSDSKTATVTVVVAKPDVTAPVAGRCSPEPDSIQVPLNNLVTVNVTDAGTGVNAGSVVIRVNNQIVYQGGEATYTSPYGRCTRSGSKNEYRYIYQPEQLADYDQTTVVKVNAADLQGNVMSEYSYAYTTEMQSFGGNKQVSQGMNTAAAGRPVTARDKAGNLWAAWHAGPEGGRDIYVARLAPGDETFQTPIRITSNALDQCNPDLATAPDGRIYVVWQDNQRGNWDVFAAICSNLKNFSKEIRVSDSNDNEICPAIAIDRQSPCRVYVAWQDDRKGNQDIYVAGSANAFVTTDIAAVTTNAADQTQPDLTVDAQNVAYAVWTDMRSGQPNLYAAASGTGPWTNVPVVTTPSEQSDPALVAEPSGTTLHLVWTDNAGGDQDIYYATLAGMPGSPVTGHTLVDDSSGADQVRPTVACAQAGKAFVCWQDARHADGGDDTDLYFAEVRSGVAKTNILVGDDNTNTKQSEPAIGVNAYGHPYVVWSDDRTNPTQVYYAAGTFIDPTPLDSKLVTAAAGATIGAEPASIDQVEDVSIVVPAGACPTDVRMTISKVANPQVNALLCLGSYDFGPSGIDFEQPVTVTVPYPYSTDEGHYALPYWYDSLTGALSQQGITDVENIVVSSTLNALRFKTTHFTAFYLVASDSGSDGASAGASSGGGGGGCSISVMGNGSPKELLVPYAAIATIMIILRRRDRRRQRLMEDLKPKE